MSMWGRSRMTRATSAGCRWQQPDSASLQSEGSTSCCCCRCCCCCPDSPPADESAVPQLLAVWPGSRRSRWVQVTRGPMALSLSCDSCDSCDTAAGRAGCDAVTPSLSALSEASPCAASPTTTSSRPCPSSNTCKLASLDRATSTERVAAGSCSCSASLMLLPVAACPEDCADPAPAGCGGGEAAAAGVPAQAPPAADDPAPCTAALPCCACCAASLSCSAISQAGTFLGAASDAACICASLGASSQTDRERWVRYVRPAAMSRTDARNARPTPLESERWVTYCSVRSSRQSSAYCRLLSSRALTLPHPAHLRSAEDHSHLSCTRCTPGKSTGRRW
mmetsp:Transcript_13142/g.32148  ORF Transcript_13142/g.32148 Transcript_13142/m.32148 type:complete len:336 (-) Transcript_13142:1234-2241(-)